MSTPLIITGIPRSGTTILAHVLRSNPEIAIHTGGGEAHILECDELRPGRCTAADAERMRAICAAGAAKYTLFKRPWVYRRVMWILDELPEARVVGVLRGQGDTVASWEASPLFPSARKKRHDQLLSDWHRERRLLGYALRLLGGRGVLLRYESFVAEPAAMMSAMASWLGVADRWDISDVSDVSPWPVGAPAPYGEAGRERGCLRRPGDLTGPPDPPEQGRGGERDAVADGAGRRGDAPPSRVAARPPDRCAREIQQGFPTAKPSATRPAADGGQASAPHPPLPAAASSGPSPGGSGGRVSSPGRAAGHSCSGGRRHPPLPSISRSAS